MAGRGRSILRAVRHNDNTYYEVPMMLLWRNILILLLQYHYHVANMVLACVLMIVEEDGGKERKSLRLNVIIYEPRKKSKLRLTYTGVSGESW